MRLSDERMKKLQALLAEELGLDYSNEQAQEAGMAIMRFVLAKKERKNFSIEENEEKNGTIVQ